MNFEIDAFGLKNGRTLSIFILKKIVFLLT